MYLKESKYAYEWIGDDGGHKVGRRIEMPSGEPITKLNGSTVCVLMRHSHDWLLELVPIDSLYLYPSEPIPQP